MKLELKHFTTYVPYGLMVQYEGIINGSEISKKEKELQQERDISFPFAINDENIIKPVLGTKTGKLKAISIYNDYWVVRCGKYPNHLKSFCGGHGLKLLLKPISEITYDNYLEMRQEIGEEKWDNSYTKYFNDLIDNFEDAAKLMPCAPQAVFEYLASKHYDVFNLIPNGLAIDINSINQTSK